MSHLATQHGYSAGEFQALQLIVLAVSWIKHLPPACWSTFWKAIFKQQLMCRFGIPYFFIFLYFDICKYICLDTSYNSLASSLLLKYHLFFKYSCTNILHRRSPCTFYYILNFSSGAISVTIHQWLNLNWLSDDETTYYALSIIRMIRYGQIICYQMLR